MRQLTAEEIQEYAARKDVKGYAVMNFLGNVKEYSDIRDALSDVANEVYRFDWNDETIVAIALGVFKAGGVVV
ncbi:hypothetical protein KAX02_06415 [candidate division WOR-3 bacterium]|nr:hypothetical protein [candidate division WOR-3 bacterium]